MPPTKRGDWVIKGSIYRNDSICIVAFNEVTKDCQIRFFLDEEVAFDYVASFN
jgi:hypothetical protein